MKKQLNEEISRIKDMMGKITIESFEDNKPNPEDSIDPELKQRVLDAAEVIQNGEGEIMDQDNGEFIAFNVGDIDLNYMYEIDVTSAPSFTPGRNWMSNGDPGYPDEGEPGEADINIYKLEVTNENGDVLYVGPDFTDMEFPHKINIDILDTFFEDYEPDYGY